MSIAVVSCMLVFAGLILGPEVVRADDLELPPAATKKVDYAKDVHPILSKRCFKCHGVSKTNPKKKAKGGLFLDTRDAALEGGDEGKIVEEKDSAKSRLIHVVATTDEDLRMPPSGKALTTEQIALLRAWIDQGLEYTEVLDGEPERPRQDLLSMDIHKGPVTSIVFSDDGSKLVTVGGDSLLFRPGMAKLYSAKKDGAMGEASVLDGHESSVWSVAFSPDGKTLATGTYGKKIKLWDVDSGKELAVIEGHNNWVTALAFLPDGKTLVSGSEDTTVRFWDVSSRKEIGKIEGHTGTVRALAVSADGKTLVTASFDKTVKLWNVSVSGDAATAAEKATIEGHTDWVWALAFSPDGKHLATGGSDNTAKVWKLGATPELVANLRGHNNWVTSLAFAPDGKRLASASFDRTVRVWSIAGEAELDIFLGHEGTIWAVRFTPDGSKIVTCSQDGSVKHWPLPALATVRRF